MANISKIIFAFLAASPQMICTALRNSLGRRPSPATSRQRQPRSRRHSERGLTAEELAEHLDVRYRKDSEGWGSREADLERWVWEVHQVAIETTYGKLHPAIPVEPADASSDCSAETARVRALNIVAGRDYQGAAMEVIEPLLARAGYRLAWLLNELWP